MKLTVIPLTSRKKDGKFSFYDELKKNFHNNKVKMENGDVIVISSKFISISQGRVLNIDNSKVCEKAKQISKKFNSNEKFMEIVFRESVYIFGGVSGFVMS